LSKLAEDYAKKVIQNRYQRLLSNLEEDLRHYEMREVRSRQLQRQPLLVPSLIRFVGVGLLSP